MLIIVSKCISTFSSLVILNNVHCHKYHQHHHWQMSCKSVTVATCQYDLSFACLTSEWRPIFRYTRSLPTLRVQVVHWRSCGLFHPPAVSILPPAKLSDNHPLGKLRQGNRINITCLNEWCRQTQKNSLESHL